MDTTTVATSTTKEPQVLTPEQQAILDEYNADRAERLARAISNVKAHQGRQ